MTENNITKCLGIGCQKKEQCKRYISINKNEQNFADFYKYIGFDGVCRNFYYKDNITPMYVR